MHYELQCMSKASKVRILTITHCLIIFHSSLLNLTAHCLTPPITHKPTVLHAKSFPSSHTGKNISKFNDMLRKSGLHEVHLHEVHVILCHSSLFSNICGETFKNAVESFTSENFCLISVSSFV